MKLTHLASLLLPVLACAYTEADYESGRVHQMIMNRKEVCRLRPFTILFADVLQASWKEHRSSGEYDSKKWTSFVKIHKDNDVIRCNNEGLAVVEPGNPDQTFKCKNVSVLLFHA